MADLGIVGLFFDNKQLANESQLFRIILEGERLEATQVEVADKQKDFLKKSSSEDLDYRFDLFRIYSLLMDRKRIAIYFGTDQLGLLGLCQKNDHQGYAIIVPDGSENYFYIEPYIDNERIMFRLFDLSDGNTTIRRIGETSPSAIRKNGHVLLPDEVIFFNSYKVQFKYQLPNLQSEATVICRKE